MPDIFTNLWGLLLTVGVLIFAAVIFWAMMRNRQTPREEARTEQATEELYDKGATDDHDR